MQVFFIRPLPLQHQVEGIRILTGEAEPTAIVLVLRWLEADAQRHWVARICLAFMLVFMAFFKRILEGQGVCGPGRLHDTLGYDGVHPIVVVVVVVVVVEGIQCQYIIEKRFIYIVCKRRSHINMYIL